MDTSVFITDNNMIMDDSDSETSSVSTVEELKNIPVQNKNKSDTVELRNKFPKPINSHEFYDKEQNCNIEDGFELVLLRLVHIWFGTDGVINFPHLTKWMDPNKTESREMEDFFIDNPGIMDDSDFYSTEAGIAVRKAWYKFLSERNFFTYVNKTHQIVPDNNNFLMFVKHFFPLVDFIGNYNEQEKLDKIYSTLSFGDNKFQVVYSTYSKIVQEMIHKSFVHNISVNKTELFVLESTNIRKTNNLEQIYWTKTELTYC